MRLQGRLIALSTAALCIPLFIPLLTGRVFTLDDLAGFHLPFRYLYQEALRAGDSFVWSPAFYSGYYLHGEGQAGMAHPLHLFLYRFLPLGPAFNLEIISSYAVAFAGTGLLIRRLGLSTEASWFGGMVFTFSGFNLMHLMHVNVVAVVSHAPWILLAAHVLLTSTDPRARAQAFAGLPLLIGSQWLLGFPQCVLMTYLTVAFLTVCLVRGATAPARVLLLFGALGLGVLVGGVQLLPSLDVLQGSWRWRLWPEYQLSFSLPPWNLVQLWSPFTFKSRIFANPEEFIPHELSVYNGAFCTVAIAWLAVRWRALTRRPLVVALLASVIITLVFALGRYAGVYVWLVRLPGLNGFRAPARYIVLFHLALSGIAAVVFEDLMSVVRCGERIPLRRLWPLAIPVVLNLVTTVLAAGLARSSWAPTNSSGFSSITQAGPWSCMMLLVAGLVALTGRGRHWSVPALVVATALDLGLWGYSYVYQEGPPETIDALAARAQVPSGAVPTDLFQPSGEGTPANVSVLRGLRLTWGYVTIDPTSVLDISDPLVQRIAGVAWRLDGPAAWSRVFDSMPRARLVSSAEVSNQMGADIRGIDISRVALVDAPIEALSGPAGLARVIRDRPGSMVVETISPARQLLVVTERFHEGWLATEDGRERHTIRVYGDYLGSVVDSGTHRVVFTFAPRSLRNGIWLTLVGLGVTLIVTLLIWPREDTAQAELT